MVNLHEKHYKTKLQPSVKNYTERNKQTQNRTQTSSIGSKTSTTRKRTTPETTTFSLSVFDL